MIDAQFKERLMLALSKIGTTGCGCTDEWSRKEALKLLDDLQPEPTRKFPHEFAPVHYEDRRTFIQCKYCGDTKQDIAAHKFDPDHCSSRERAYFKNECIHIEDTNGEWAYVERKEMTKRFCEMIRAKLDPRKKK